MNRTTSLFLSVVAFISALWFFRWFWITEPGWGLAGIIGIPVALTVFVAILVIGLSFLLHAINPAIGGWLIERLNWRNIFKFIVSGVFVFFIGLAYLLQNFGNVVESWGPFIVLAVSGILIAIGISGLIAKMCMNFINFVRKNN